jgi:hypothetical protein
VLVVLIGLESGLTNVEIKMTNHHRILRLIFDQRLNWKEHIKDEKRQQILLRIHQMIILSTLKYGDVAYGSASPTTLKTLDPCPSQRNNTSSESFCRVMPKRKRFT